jgi:predicted O-methyltransferase YrrM
MVRPDLAAVVAELVLETRPMSVVEAGSGVSTVVIGYALRRAGGGRVLPLEDDPTFADEARSLIWTHGLEEVARVVHAPLVPYNLDGEKLSWYERSAWSPIETIDLLIIDGPSGETSRRARFPAIPLIGDRLSTHSIVILDDAHRRDERETLRRWRAALEDPEVRWLARRDGGTAAFLAARGSLPRHLDRLSRLTRLQAWCLRIRRLAERAARRVRRLL